MTRLGGVERGHRLAYAHCATFPRDLRDGSRETARRSPRDRATVPRKEAAITPAALTEGYLPPDPVLLHAMSWAAELGVGAVTPGAGAVLRLLAAAVRIRTAVEIGTGTGVSGLWLLRGAPPDAVLTSIDVEAELQAMARQAFAAAGFPTGRARLIAGVAADVLPRLADGGYDLVFVDVPEAESCVDAAHRLLRDGGLLVVNDAYAAADLVLRFRDSADWLPAVIGAGTGLLCAVKRG
jgi:predicted O-methyltransferase YrrM